jgi:hypothetical protein
MALSDCSRQVSWICNIFLELGICLGPIPIYADNQGSIFIGSNPVQEIHTKHIDVKYHYVHECIAVKKIVLYHIPTSAQTSVSVHVVHVTHSGFVQVVHMTHSTGARVRLHAPHSHSTWPHASTYIESTHVWPQVVIVRCMYT